MKNRDTAILIIYTGGTIGMISENKEYSPAPLDSYEVMRYVPELKKSGYDISVTSFGSPVDSSEINPDHWTGLAGIIEENYERFDGFVILHGTDTMAYSASALSFLLENLGKPVIFTGSQIPISTLRTDAKENLISSIEIAAARKNQKPVVPEVCIYFEFKLYRGNRTTKYNAENFNAFVSGNYPPLAESGIRIRYNSEYILYPRDNRKFKAYKELCNQISILKIFPGIGKEAVHAVLRTRNLRGLIIETFGAGNAPTSPWLGEELKKTDEQGIIMLNVTQCNQGKVEMGRYKTSQQLIRAGVISGHDITTEAAVTKMMYLLGREFAVEKTKQLLNKPIRGEIT